MKKKHKIIHFTILERRGTLSQSPCNVNTSHPNLLQNPLSNKLMSHVLMKISLTAWYSTPSTDPDLIPSKSWPKISTRDSIWGTLLEEILMSYGRQIYAFISSRKPTTNCFNSATTVAIELFERDLAWPIAANKIILHSRQHSLCINWFLNIKKESVQLWDKTFLLTSFT